MRSSNNNPDQANRKDNSKGKVKKLDAAVIADLKKSKLILPKQTIAVSANLER